MALLQLVAQTNLNPNTANLTTQARFFPPLLAFFIAYFFTVLELITSKYRRTYSLIFLKPSLHIYGFIYGIFALVIVLVWDSLVKSGSLKIEGLGLSNIWWKSILIGISTKGFLKIRLWNVNVGSNPFPVGIDSLVQLFEPWLLEEIGLSEFYEVRKFLQHKIDQYKNLSLKELKKRMEDNIPKTLKEQDKKVFKLDLSEAKNPMDAMEIYLSAFGKNTLELVFPDPHS